VRESLLVRESYSPQGCYQGRKGRDRRVKKKGRKRRIRKGVRERDGKKKIEREDRKREGEKEEVEKRVVKGGKKVWS